MKRKLQDDPKIQKALAELKALIAKLPDDRKAALDDYLTTESQREGTDAQKIEKRRQG
ncbi:MAG: hypothetical protein ACLPVO_15405 [Desulfomonilaceae bacterium]